MECGGGFGCERRENPYSTGNGKFWNFFSLHFADNKSFNNTQQSITRPQVWVETGQMHSRADRILSDHNENTISDDFNEVCPKARRVIFFEITNKKRIISILSIRWNQISDTTNNNDDKRDR